MPARTCAGCGVELPPPTQGRPRTKCEACSPPRLRDVKRRAPHKLAAVAEIEPAPREAGGLLDATRSELERAGRLESVFGQAALALAGQLACGQHSGAGFAALVKELRATMAQALEGAAVEADPLDEIKRIRDRKLGRA